MQSQDSKSGATRSADIRFVRIDHPVVIPRRLLEQLPQEPFTSDEWVASYMPHPVNFLYMITDRNDKDEPRKGFFWGQANPLEKCLRILLMSLDKEFSKENPGFVAQVAMTYCKGMAKTLGAKYLVWSRFKASKTGQTHHGKVREIPVLSLEV